MVSILVQICGLVLRNVRGVLCHGYDLHADSKKNSNKKIMTRIIQ